MQLVWIPSPAPSAQETELRALFRAIEKKARAAGQLQLLMDLDRLAELRGIEHQAAALVEFGRIADAAVASLEAGGHSPLAN